MRRAFFKTSARSSRVRLPGLGVCSLVMAALALTSMGLRAQAPNQTWRTLETEHFRITFPKGMETLARRAGDRAELARAQLVDAFVPAPKGKIDILLTDHTDVTNGFAQVTPSDRITIFARPPVDDPNLGYMNDWMQLVIDHELTHIFHLDEAGPLGMGLRAVFGRVPVTWPFFPDLGLPRWTTEGSAEWYESLLTHAGRTDGTYAEMAVRTAILEHRFESLDEASGDSPTWPAGNRAYIYGAQFFDYLLGRYGDEKLGDFARAVAGQWIPYRLNAAGEKAFGESISRAWREWTDSLEHAYGDLPDRLRELGPLTDFQRLTHGAQYGQNARLSPDGKHLAFVWADGRSEVQIRIADPDGSNGRELARTNGLSTFDWMPDGSILMSQLQLQDPYRSYVDLYVVSPDGHERRLTDGRRLDYPSVAPNGKWAVAVQEGDGKDGLVRVDLATGQIRTLCAPSLDTLWTFPKVSPDGRWIAATRWTPGAYSDVVVIDTSCHERVALTHDRALDLAPAWTPDGKTVLWGSDRSDIADILAADVDPEAGTHGPLRMATNVETGAEYPTVDPSGKWLYASVYHANGWDVERTPLTPSAWPPAPPVAERFDAPPRTWAAQKAEATGPVHPYSAATTLRPYYWEPAYWAPISTPTLNGPAGPIRGRQVLSSSVGAQTSGQDLVGRHSFQATGRIFTSGARAAGSASYTYAGLGNPLISVGASQSWGEDGVHLAQQQQNAPYDTLFTLLRERAVGASMTLIHARWRDAWAASLGEAVDWDHRDLLGNDLRPTTQYRLTLPDTRVNDLRLTLQYTSVRTHSFQIGPAQGLSVMVRGRLRRSLGLPDSLSGHLGFDEAVDEVMGQVSDHQLLGGPGFAAHILALRGSFGYARGPGAHAGWFDVGGASGSSETLTGLSLFGGTPLFFPVRGYPQSSRSGARAWSASAEYRFPLLLLNRGLGPWPLNLDRTIGVLFVDAGNAWGPQLGVAGYQNPPRATLASVGGELVSDVLTFWTVPLTVRLGLGVPLVEGSGTQFYVRLGLPF